MDMLRNGIRIIAEGNYSLKRVKVNWCCNVCTLAWCCTVYMGREIDVLGGADLL